MSAKLPAVIPFRLGEIFDFNYGHTAESFLFPPEGRTNRIPAEVRTNTIGADRRTA